MTLNGATDTAKQAIKGFEGTPALLAIMLINMARVGALIYIASSQRDERAVLTKYLIDCQKAAP
jgi:hypothetical protein